LNGSFDGIDYRDSFTSDLVYLPESNQLLVLDLANYRMARIDCVSGTVTASVPTGRLPFGLAVSPDRRFALVANVGMYAYPLVEGATPQNYDSLLLNRHPYAHNTETSKKGYETDGRKIPGVGDPNVEEAMSVYVIDLTTLRVRHRLKTGLLVGDSIGGKEVIGGSSPNSIAVGRQRAFITNATNDNIDEIDFESGRIVRRIPLKITQTLDTVRGYLPFGISMSPDEGKLYVALLGLNAVAVVDVESGSVDGLIPTGWGPARVQTNPSGNRLFITSCRGLGAGPNGGKGFKAPVQGTYVGDIQLATLQDLPVPDPELLKTYTRQALENTFMEYLSKSNQNVFPLHPGEKGSPIRHIVYVTKENRTYDEVLGQLPEGNGDSTLARFGVHVPLKTKNGIVLTDARITPNHHRLARQFAFSDNFYCDSDASIHGHHWMLGVIPNEWVETNSNTSKTARLFSTAPGRRFPGSTGSMDPEDFAETGGLWEVLDRNGIDFYNFGEANETAHVRENWDDTATGAAHGVMVPMQKALYSRTSRGYAGYNMNIPDQFRMKQFEKEFTDKWLSGKDTMPPLITIQLPNDHTASPRPKDGYPYIHSYVADNDLALGRLMHFLSRTPYWKNMLVIITEDDPQGGIDHVDAHRSLLLMAGPYVKKGYVSHIHASFSSILKVIYNILGVPYVNQYDITASLLDDFFTDIPDLTPYTAIPSDKRVFDPDKALKRYNTNLDWRKVLQGPAMDDATEIRKSHYKERKLGSVPAAR
jgi:YVTN family beta-propeller protein